MAVFLFGGDFGLNGDDVGADHTHAASPSMQRTSGRAALRLPVVVQVLHPDHRFVVVVVDEASYAEPFHWLAFTFG